MRASLLLAAGALFAAAIPRPAEACSSFPGCTRHFGFASQGQPLATNARIPMLVSCEGGTRLPADAVPVLRRLDGTEVESVWVRERDGFVRTGPELRANETVLVQDTWGDHCLARDLHPGGPLFSCDTLPTGPVETLFTFSTTDGPDLVPPPTPPAAQFFCNEVHLTEDEAFCGPAGPVDAWWADALVHAPNHADVVSVRLYWRRGDEAYDFTRPGVGGTALDVPPSVRPGDWRVVATTVDRAGNESEPSPEAGIRFPEDCEFDEPYPGYESRGGPLHGEAAGGCDSAPGPTSGWALLAIVLGYRRAARISAP